MTAYLLITLVCDGIRGIDVPCDVTWQSGTDSAEAARYVASREGWGRTNGGDLCPTCSGGNR